MDREEARKKAQALVAQMTVEEAASQLRYDSPAIERLGVPEYNWWNECLHGVARAGVATCFPQAIGMGATFDEELIEEIGRATSLEARAKYNRYAEHEDRTKYKGVTMWTPNINIFRDPRWGRGQETYGEDPVLTAALGCAMVEGLQHEEDGYMTVAACAKHLAVHSGPELLRHEFDAKVSQKDLWETYLPAFEACVTKANVEAVMGAYNRTNGDPCCAHPYLMGEILRGEWNFQGHFVSDCWAIRDFHEHHHVTEGPEESAAMALKAGCDLNCGCTYVEMLSAYLHGKVSEEEIRTSAVRLFTTRYLLGLFDHSALDEIPYSVVGCPKHLELAYRAAVESCVLLKNDGILPLDTKAYRTIGVVGPNADSQDVLVGNYSGTPMRSITFLEGIRAQCEQEGIRVLYSEGSHLYKDMKQKPFQNYRIAEAAITAENSDLIILCVGLDATLEGEGGDVGNEYASGDKSNLLLPPCQRELVETVMHTGTPFILLNASGSPIDLSAYEEKASAILQVWYPGGEGGRAVADILFGKEAPCGKLPVTFYYNDNKLPDITDYRMQGRTYRYLSEKPWYRFGYGLTYGKADVKELVLSQGEETSVSYEAAGRDGLNCRVVCENIGERDVNEVLQIYVHVKGSVNEVPNSKLAAFQRIRLAKGETKEFTLQIPAAAFQTVDQEGRRAADGSGAVVYAGFSQPEEIEYLTSCKNVSIL
ncbi:MAG: glycoside hydrolase family 3 C-terminal domain-containing protein [Candidatus Gastranaerophilales bacterium]|nr:glycoside hydrolase family 3 C-terminal domain-containing protein [Candidatus Gastranaerophilales bacterium]